jgi:hypothetical protein
VTILKWLIALLLVGYFCGLVALFFMQRSYLFPIPPVGRTSPQAAGFPQAEEHVLTTSDGEKVIIWYVPAKPGHPVVLFFQATAISWRDASSAFAASPLTGPGSSPYPIVAMPARPESQVSRGC